jgi:hypothetical protein
VRPDFFIQDAPGIGHPTIVPSIGQLCPRAIGRIAKRERRPSSHSPHRSSRIHKTNSMEPWISRNISHPFSLSGNANT